MLCNSTAFAGTERHIVDLTTALNAQNVQTEIFCRPNSRMEEYADGIKLHRTDKHLLHPASLWALCRLLQKGNFDLVHAHDGITSFAAALSKTVLPQLKFACTYHFIKLNRLNRSGIKAGVANLMHRLAEKQIDVSIAISQAVLDSCSPMIGKPMVIVHNGIPECQQEHSDIRQLRADLNVRHDDVMLFTAARLAKEKSLDVLIRSMSILKDRKNIRCFIAGEGPARAQLEEQINNLGLEQTVKLLGFRNDIDRLMQAADIFVLPSEAEPFGLSILEAMRAAKPVIAAAAGGPLEIVDSSCGILFAPGIAEQLATAITRLADNQELAKRLGLAGQKRMKMCFSAYTMAMQTYSAYCNKLKNACLTAEDTTVCI